MEHPSPLPQQCVRTQSIDVRLSLLPQKGCPEILWFPFPPFFESTSRIRRASVAHRVDSGIWWVTQLIFDSIYTLNSSTHLFNNWILILS